MPRRRVLGVIAAGAAAVVLLWWHDATVSSGLAGWLTGAGRITGLLAGYGVAVLLVLMSRWPVLERRLGSDQLARWHASGGRYVVGLVVAHGVLVTWGYAVTAHINVASQSWTLLRSYPDVLMATVAGLLLVGVGVASARAARRWMRYETWYLLHFYTYLAVALAFSHQFSTGADFVTNPPARVLWAGLYLAAAGLVVTYRFAVPIHHALRHRARVLEVRPEASGVVSMTIRTPLAAVALPGQFFRCRFLTRRWWWQSHPFSMSAMPRGELMRITVKDLGDHTAELQELRPGTRVLLEGPYGSMTASRRTRRGVLLLAGGIGITPLRALFEQLASADVSMIVRARRVEDVVFRSEIDAISARRGARVHLSCGPSGGDTDIFAGDRLRALVPDIASRDVYLCGPPGFAVAATQALRRLGVPQRCVHAESFEF